MSNALRILKEKNEYPIVFIGSGISRRYLSGFPGWNELLKEFWDDLNTSKDFYGFLNNLRREIEERGIISEYDLDYQTNIAAGSEIEVLYNEKFFREETVIPGFDQEKAYKTRWSPFKVALSNRFSLYQIKQGMTEEYKLFKAFINKTQIVITTNYDTFIEDSVNSDTNGGMKKYIGQKGFFEPTVGWSEIYKIHGCVEEPSSIVISKPDYDRFEKNSILISAKIITMLIHSPIIFLGYSLTDGNVRKIIRDFSSSMTPDEIKKMASKIIIVEREEGQRDIVEQTFYDKDLGCEYTVLKTDNYELLCSILTEIDQGVHPAEVRKYQHVIKKLIVNRGKSGSLNTLLLSPEGLEDIERRIGDEKLVVALGETTYIFQMPDLLTYVYDYFFGGKTIHTEIALRFIASQAATSRIPFLKHVEGVDIDSTSLHSTEKEKLKQRIERYASPDSCIRSISETYKIRARTIAEIVAQGHQPYKEYEIISYNSLRINTEEIGQYLKGKLEVCKADGLRSLLTPFRRLLMIYDFLTNK
ncbi:SIR2 family protein [Cohnella panacarvi]|uniref:SIR2 family protein n=1 Tax=Cohnella panacarvi TaxID=400776 RepID=UPI00047AD1D8|nr:SIR2 family protein [Cohnella panacarvi]